MAEEQATIQANYRARKAKSGLRQVVLYLPHALAEALKVEARRQGCSRSELVTSRLQGDAPRPTRKITSYSGGRWPDWMPEALTKTLEEDAKAVGVPPEQLAAERLALASRKEHKRAKATPSGKGTPPAPVKRLAAEADRLGALAARLRRNDERRLTDASFAGRVLERAAREIEHALPHLSRKGGRRKRSALYQAWVRVDASRAPRYQTFLVVAKDDRAAARLIGERVGRFRETWTDADVRHIGATMTVTGAVWVSAGRYPSHSDAWWPVEDGKRAQAPAG